MAESKFKFVGEGIGGSFNSIDEAVAYAEKKNKLPRNGKSWVIEETKRHEVESRRKVVRNPEITRRVIEYFLEHATIDNVKSEAYSYRNQDGLGNYKKQLRKLMESEGAIERMVWEYNTGDLKECNNYKLVIVPPARSEDDKRLQRRMHLGARQTTPPGIMFRPFNDTPDVLITYDNYYGRNVHLRSAKAVDEDEKLYRICKETLDKA